MATAVAPIETARMVAALFSNYSLTAEKAVGIVAGQAKCDVSLAREAARVVWPQWFTVVEPLRIVRHRSKVFTHTTEDEFFMRWVNGKSEAFKRCWSAIVNTCETLKRDNIDYTVDWSGLSAKVPFVVIQGQGVNTYRYPNPKRSRYSFPSPKATDIRKRVEKAMIARRLHRTSYHASSIASYRAARTVLGLQVAKVFGRSDMVQLTAENKEILGLESYGALYREGTPLAKQVFINSELRRFEYSFRMKRVDVKPTLAQRLESAKDLLWDRKLLILAEQREATREK